MRTEILEFSRDGPCLGSMEEGRATTETNKALQLEAHTEDDFGIVDANTNKVVLKCKGKYMSLHDRKSESAASAEGASLSTSVGFGSLLEFPRGCVSEWESGARERWTG